MSPTDPATLSAQDAQTLMLSEQETIIAVNSADEPLHPVGKKEAHRYKGTLHRAVTVFLKNSQDQYLLTQRSQSKPLWPLWWDAACSTHQWWPDESSVAAAIRRIPFEIGITPAEVAKLDLKSQYSYEYHAVYSPEWAENEVNHVVTALYDGELVLNPAEVASATWKTAAEITKELTETDHRYAPWFAPAWEILQRLERKDWC